jgi:type I restriction enzyme, S subunit
VSEFPSGWLEASVIELGTVITGSTPSTKDDSNWGGEVPFVTPGDMKHMGVTTTTERSVTSRGAERGRMLPPGAVLVTCIGGLGRTTITGSPCLSNQQINAVIPDRSVSSPYFAYACCAPRFQRQLIDASTSTTVALVNKSNFEKLTLPVAPTPEQQRIVAAIEEQFSRLDAGVAALERVRQNLKRMRAAVLQAAVTGRSIAGAPPQGYEAEDLPQNWSWQPLEEIITRLRNGIFVSRPVADHIGPPILRISAVRPLSLDITDVRFVPNPGKLGRADDFVLSEGDLLFTRYSGNPEYVGACAIVPPGAPKLLYPDKLIRVQVDRTIANPRFIAIAATAGRTRREIRARVKTTAGQTGISGGDLKTVPFPLPPLPIQEAIVGEVDRSLDRIITLESEVDRAFHRASSLRSSLLTAAFSGKLFTQGPNDEPASVLLERIAADRAASNGHRPARKSRSARTTV